MRGTPAVYAGSAVLGTGIIWAWTPAVYAGSAVLGTGIIWAWTPAVGAGLAVLGTGVIRAGTSPEGCHRMKRGIYEKAESALAVRRDCHPMFGFYVSRWRKRTEAIRLPVVSGTRIALP